MKIRFNLLPENQKKHLRTQKTLRTIMEQEIYIVIIFGILILTLFAMYFLLKTESVILREVEEGIIAQSGYAEIVDIHNQFQDVHTKMNTISSIDRDVIRWSNLFEMMNEMFTQNIVVSSLKISEKSIAMTAVANSRENVVELKDQFRNKKRDDIECFNDIIVPESDLAAPRDVSFTMTFTINPDCLK